MLDIKFLNKIDMSLVRKEFLDITNLCKLSFHPSFKSNKKKEPPHGKRKSVSSRPRSLPSTEKLNINKRSKHQTESDSWEDDESTVSQVIHSFFFLLFWFSNSVLNLFVINLENSPVILWVNHSVLFLSITCDQKCSIFYLFPL